MLAAGSGTSVFPLRFIHSAFLPADCKHVQAAAADQPAEELLRWRLWRGLPGLRRTPTGHDQSKQ